MIASIAAIVIVIVIAIKTKYTWLRILAILSLIGQVLALLR